MQIPSGWINECIAIRAASPVAYCGKSATIFPVLHWLNCGQYTTQHNMSPVLHADVSAAAAAADKHLLSSASKDILIQAHAIRTFSKKPRVHHRLTPNGKAGEKVNICFHLDYSEKSIAHEENGFNERR